jgi:hypothetical protein
LHDACIQVITPEIRVTVHFKPVRGPLANELITLRALWVNLDKMAALRDKEPVFVMCDEQFQARDPVKAITLELFAQKAGLSVHDWKTWIKLAQDYTVHAELTLPPGTPIGRVSVSLLILHNSLVGCTQSTFLNAMLRIRLSNHHCGVVPWPLLSGKKCKHVYVRGL